MEISIILDKLSKMQNLTNEECERLMALILDGQLPESQIAAVLMGLKMKGETVTEVTAIAKVMREKAIDMHIPEIDAIDTCGTGGDGKHTFNISTVSAIIASAAGCYIAKHGNRAISSKCGSADVLKELGININADILKVKENLKQIGICFLFAPEMHVAMKHVMPVRKALGIRTVFNMLGPLTNPARASKQVIGVFDEKLCEVYGKVLLGMGHKKAYILHGNDGMDEATISDTTKVVYLNNGVLETFTISPEDFGIKRASVEEIKGGDTPLENANILRDILSCKISGSKKDISCLNAAFAINLSGRGDTLQESYKIACETVDSGKAFRKLNEWVNSFN